MSIFGIIGISLLIGLAAVGLYALIVFTTMSYYDNFSTGHKIAMCFIGIGITVICTFIGIGINTRSAKAYVAEFEARKAIIESSLENENLGGLERVELVDSAATLNGELAKRQSLARSWDYVYYESDIYENVEYISFDNVREEKEE